tara:strand:- start:18299 stop:19888 length:1590 start_codon:yes stop_codon:yes gene_type:complete
MITLRPYQNEAVSSVFNYWKTKRGPNPLIVAPTGAGKSLIIADICRSAIAMHGGVRILILTHVQELISQNYDEVHKLYPECNAGIYSSGLKRKDKKQNVIFAGIQSIESKIHNFDPFHIVLIDEAHTIPRNSSTRYGRIKDTLKLMNPKIKFVGLTATPYRLDSGRLFGPGCLFCGVSYEISISFLIKEGYLANVISKGGVKKLDLSSVKKRGGEYLDSDLSRVASDPDLVTSVVTEIISYGKDRKAWLVFASSISHAQLLLDEFKLQDIDSVKMLTGDLKITSKEERSNITESFKGGELKCLINIGTLTTGFNAPVCDLVAMVRATMSTGLYVQIVGRGMRTYPDKKNCLFLDYGDNVIQHGPIDCIPTARAKAESTGGGEAPQKECPKCHSFAHIIAKECLDCGYVFPKKENVLTHQATAFSGAMLTEQIKPDIFDVVSVSYSKCKKSGYPEALKVLYFTGLYTYDELIFLGDHSTNNVYANGRIARRGGTAKTVNDALKECHEYIKPGKIHVTVVGKWPKIVDYEY